MMMEKINLFLLEFCVIAYVAITVALLEIVFKMVKDIVLGNRDEVLSKLLPLCITLLLYALIIYPGVFSEQNMVTYICDLYKTAVEQVGIFVFTLCVWAAIVVFVLWYRSEMKKRLKYARFVSHKYIEAVRKADDAERELASMQDGYSSFVKQKEEEVKELKERASRYREEFEALTANAQEDAFRSDSVVGHFTRASQKLNAHTLVSSSDWEALNMSASRLIPGFYNSISRDGRLTEREKSVAILLWLNFRESQISALLNITPQSTTNLKSRINERLFSDSRASTLKGRLKSIGVDEGQPS